MCGILVVPPSGGVGSSPPRAIWFIAEVRSHQDLRQNRKIGEQRREKKIAMKVEIILLKCDACQKKKKEEDEEEEK